jgi:hypothetical protein
VPDSLDTLSRLADGGAAPGLPAAEVRRRGDRLRRRRTALQAVGATAAIAVVMGAGATLTGAFDRQAGPAPAPATRPPTTAPTALPAIPAGFPLDQGIPDPGGDGTLTGPSGSKAAAVPPIKACGVRAYPVEQPFDRLSVRYQAPGDFRARELTVYRDTSVATLVVDGFVRAMRDCPREDVGGNTAVTRNSRFTAGDESWGFVTTYEQGGRAALGLQVTTATRVGPYVLVATQSSEGSLTDAQRQLDQQLTQVRSLVGALAVVDPVLTHDGYGSLRLGMTGSEVEATGEAELREGAGCAGIALTDHGVRQDQVDGFVSPTQGLVALFARPNVRTEEGSRVGDTRQQVQATYGGGIDDSPFASYTLGAGTSYVFGFDGDKVVSIALQRDRQDCYQ